MHREVSIGCKQFTELSDRDGETENRGGTKNSAGDRQRHTRGPEGTQEDRVRGAGSHGSGRGDRKRDYKKIRMYTGQVAKEREKLKGKRTDKHTKRMLKSRVSR